MVSHQLIAEVLLPCEAVQMGLQSVVLKASNQTLCPQLQTQMECSIAETEESRRAEELLSFANSKKSEKLLSVISAAVPSSILPPGCCADLFDIRAGRSGPDDRIYNKHADIRMMIPRGATILEWRSKKSSWSSVVIYGHKKFTGGIGDEDNEQPENNEKWREYFIAEPSEATSVVCMDKLNGEAAHISCRYIDDQFYLIVGSKNVHMLIRGSCDIDQYEGSRYVYAKAIAATVCDTLASLDARKRHLLLSFLHHTRCTLVGEILQEKSQHIVNLSHLTKPQVVIIAMTPTYTGCQEKSLLAVPPHHLLDFCCALGLRTVTYTVIPVTQAMDQKALVRRKIDSEGEVFYYLDKNDDTIGLVKVKTVWYVILRALREKAVYSFTTGKKKSHWDISDCVRSTHKRFTEIQKWLKFSDEYLHSWQNLARNFLHWLNEEVKARKEEPGKIRWKLERAFLRDEFTFIAPLPSESFDLEDQVFEDCDSAPGKTQNLGEDSPAPSNNSEVNPNLEDNAANNKESSSFPLMMDVSKDESVEKDSENNSCGVPVPAAGAVERAKVSQTVSDFSDPLHSYLNSGASPQESPLEPPQGTFSLTEQPLANSFRKAVDETILSCSPYLRYSVPYLESEVGQNCFLRKYFQKDLYFSVQFEKDNLMRRPKFSEMEPKHAGNSSNIEIQDLHNFIKLKLTNGVQDKNFQAVLADFRARGGQMRNICKCEDSASDVVYNEYLNICVERPSNGLVIVESLPSVTSGQNAEGGNSSISKANSNSLWSGQSALMLTANGRVDALHPFNHQRLSLLFSSYSQMPESGSPPAFCVNPWVLTMDFYGRNDIPLGAFLERYCFSPTYTCPSGQCSVPVLDHIRKFVHDTGCVDVVLRNLDTDLDVANTGSILVWSWCKVCRQVTPVQPMSLETWSLSFAKYLELRFYGGSFTRRGNPSCGHSLHHDHYQYFGYKNHVAVFKYNAINLREIALPPSKIRLCNAPISQTSIVELIKGVAVQGYSVFSTILEKVTTLLSECGIRWQPLIIEISEHQNSQRSKFRENIESIQLQLTSPTLEARRLHPPTPSSTAELSTTMLAITDQVTLLKKLIAQVVNEWNMKVQDLVQLRKKEEKLEKAKTLASVGAGGMLPRQSTSTSMSTSSALSAHTTTSSGEMHSAVSHKQSGDSASVASSAALTGLSTESLSISASLGEVPDQNPPKSGSVDIGEDVADDAEVLEASSSPQSNDAQKPLGIVYVTPSAECLMEERDHILQALAALTACTKATAKTGQSVQSLSSVSSDVLQSIETEGDVGGGLQAIIPHQLSDAFSVVHRRQASDSCEGLVSGCSPTSGSPGRGHERSLSDGGQATVVRDSVERSGERRLPTTAVKSIISTFWSTSATLLVESPFPASEHYLLLPEVKIPVVVYGEEPSSIIAHALTSQEYEKQLNILKKRLKDMQKEGTSQRSVDLQQSSEGGSESTTHEDTDFCLSAAADPEKNKLAKDLHIELQWNDQHAKFYCKIFFAEHFRQLRKMVFPYGEEHFIRSLSRCILWEARGGKSGSVFCKSKDDRFILKEMSRFEMNSFLDFGQAYVQYIVNCEKEQQPTVLTRIVGVYRIGYKNTTTNKAQRMDVLVMENLFYQRNITHKFDLKGSIRNRLVNTSGKEESELVLLDENLVRMACSSPLYVRPHSKTVINRAIKADTVFLSQQLIMDYSLLVGIDDTANELIVGIIDYIRTFTWDKKLETIIKGSMLGGGAGKLPTVVSPEVYRTRFCHAMDRYFLLSPDRWTGLGLGVDP